MIGRSIIAVVCGTSMTWGALPPGVAAAERETRSAPSEQTKDPWEPLRPLVGSWEGTGRGSSGTSRIERHYEFVLQDQFLYARNKSVFDPQEANPKGETHEDWSLFSYDRTRDRIVLREFHTEGFVNEYELDEPSADGKTLVFTTTRVENAPPGFRARLTCRFVGDDELTETFELAPAGQPFAPCVTTHLKRKE